MPKDKRRLLLDAAAEQFAKFGVHGTRVQAIVKRSGVNERMIYHHFGSKEGLYRAVLADQWTAAAGFGRPERAQTRQLEPVEALRIAFHDMFEGFAARPLMLPLAMHESMSGWKSLPKATLAQIPAHLRELYERGQRAGVFRDCDFETIYLTLIGALTSLALLATRFSDVREQVRREPAHLARMADRMIDLVLDGARAVPNKTRKAGGRT
jgi:AcrR family transcriptional regulator